MQQIDTKIKAYSRRSFELVELLTQERRKNAKMSFSAPLGSVCKRQFHDTVIDILGVESLIQQVYEG